MRYDIYFRFMIVQLFPDHEGDIRYITPRCSGAEVSPEATASVISGDQTLRGDLSAIT